MQEMIHDAVEGRMDNAARIHRSLLPLFNAMGIVPNPMPIKYALNYLGFGVGGLRLPLVWPDSESAATIERVLSSTRIDLSME